MFGLNTKELSSGENIEVPKRKFEIAVYWSTSIIPHDQVDASAFLLSQSGKVRSDNDFVFYNQPQAENGCVVLKTVTHNESRFYVELDKIPSTISKVPITIVIHANVDISAFSKLYIKIANIAKFQPKLNNRKERALILGELYRYKNIWKFRALGQGYNGGLAPLATSYGVDVDSSTDPSLHQDNEQPVNHKKNKIITLEKALKKKVPKLVKLAKPVGETLEKYQLLETEAKVAFILDASGSMAGQFHSGNVQAVLDRVAILALNFDDDGCLDIWAYADRNKKLPDVSLNNLENYIKNHNKEINSIGYGNNEPPIMQKVINFYKKTKLPAYVIFITDGGVYQDNEIKKLVIGSAKYPIFWQFVGLGGHGYGILKELDTLSGRLVDNANFFAIDDFNSISDEELYDRLLNEFPIWIKAARKKHILR